MVLEPEEEEIAMATGDWGFFCAIWPWEEDEVCREESRFGMRLNSKKIEDRSAVSHSTRSQL